MKILYNIISAMKEMYEKKIAHKNLCPEIIYVFNK